MKISERLRVISENHFSLTWTNFNRSAWRGIFLTLKNFFKQNVNFRKHCLVKPLIINSTMEILQANLFAGPPKGAEPSLNKIPLPDSMMK